MGPLGFGKQACKPNSVSACAATVIPLGDALLRRSSSLPEGLSHFFAKCSARRAGTLRTRSRRNERLREFPPYLALLRVGFTLPIALRRSRCALTAPFHPYPARRTEWAVHFLWHWPYRSLDAATPDVIRHIALRSSDFPLLLLACAGGSSDRPACLLRSSYPSFGGWRVPPIYEGSPYFIVKGL